MAKLMLRVDFEECDPARARQDPPARADRRARVHFRGGGGMGMSYRRAWLLVDDLNRCFKEPLVQTQCGGSGGGGAELSSFGRMVVDSYRAMEHEAATALARWISVLEQGLADGSPQQGGS